MKKLIFTILVIIICLSLTTCETLQTIILQPIISFHSVRLEGINLNGVQLLNFIQIENPNGFEIPFPEIGWDLFVNANSFISGVIRNNQRLRARDSTLVEVPVNLDYLGVFNSFASLIGSREFNYKTAFALRFNLPVLGNMVWNLEHEGIIPLPQLPRISAPSMRIGSSSLTGTEIIVSINVNNPNGFPIPTPKISYDYQVNRNSFIRGNVENEAPLSPSSNSQINIPIAINYLDLFQSFASLITAREVASNLVLTCDFDIPLFNAQPLRFETAGVLPLR